MSKVFVLDTDKQPLTPVHPGGARYLLKEGKAAVYRRYPFTIIMRADCDTQNMPLQVEHILSRAKGGTDRTSNLTLACEPCNLKKGTQDIRDFLAHDHLQLARILAQARAPLKDATAVNAVRWHLLEQLKATGLPVETGSGGLTKCNRTTRALPKTHWLDAACVGTSTPPKLSIEKVVPLLIWATGRGHRRMCNTNERGFPVSYRKRLKRYFGFQTGDMVRAVVPGGVASRGTHVGRVAVRSRGTFNITTKHGKITDVPHRFCQLIGRTNGYRYQTGGRHATLSTTSV